MGISKTIIFPILLITSCTTFTPEEIQKGMIEARKSQGYSNTDIQADRTNEKRIKNLWKIKWNGKCNIPAFDAIKSTIKCNERTFSLKKSIAISKLQLKSYKIARNNAKEEHRDGIDLNMNYLKKEIAKKQNILTPSKRSRSNTLSTGDFLMMGAIVAGVTATIAAANSTFSNATKTKKAVPKKNISQRKAINKKVTARNLQKKGVKNVKVVGKQFGKFNLYRVNCYSGRTESYYMNSKQEWWKIAPVNFHVGYKGKAINDIARMRCN